MQVGAAEGSRFDHGKGMDDGGVSGNGKRE